MGSCIGKYESPTEAAEDGIWRKTGMCGKTSSSSSVDASVGRVGLVMEAADEAGSIDAMLLRNEGMETRERVRKGHDGGESGDAGVDSS
jgi:hypothetical protein